MSPCSEKPNTPPSRAESVTYHASSTSVLAERGYRTSETAYALFSRAGFTDEPLAAARNGGVHLLDLDALYGDQSG
jgi:hypothetical protein